MDKKRYTITITGDELSSLIKLRDELTRIIGLSLTPISPSRESETLTTDGQS